MLRKLLMAVVCALLPLSGALAQKKEIAQAKANVKADKSLAEAEASMRKLLADSTNRDNEKIWLVLFDAVKRQYEIVNEKMYLKQAADTTALFGAAYRMFGVLEGLDSVDVRKDGGKGKLKFRKRNAEYLNALRQNLYNGGLFHVRKKDFAKAYEFFDRYVDCAVQPLFSGYDYAANDARMAQAAFYSVYCGYKEGDAKHTLKYAEMAQGDTARLDMTYQYMAYTYSQLKDTAKCVEVMQRGFARFPRTAYYFSHLFDHYFKAGDAKVALALCNDAIAADSANYMAQFAKSTVLLTLGRYDECIGICDTVVALHPDFADAYLNAGLAYYNQAIHIDTALRHTRDNIASMKALYKKAMPYMQSYRKLAPGEKARWGMPLYNIYLNLNMGKEFDEIDALLKK